MQTLATRPTRLARKIERPTLSTGKPMGRRGRSRRPVAGSAPSYRPTRGPHGQVDWWARPAPGGNEALWQAVRHLQTRRQQLGVSVTDLARRLTRRGHPLTRETLSRVLNGKQPTSWATVEALADLLAADLPDR